MTTCEGGDTHARPHSLPVTPENQHFVSSWRHVPRRAANIAGLRSLPLKPQMREKSTGGDRLTEGVASKLQFLTSKDYAALFRDLSEAAGAYKIAQDPEGSQVMTGCRVPLTILCAL